MIAPQHILTIDGPSGSGKGTVSLRIASELGWHYLDSGAIYRVFGYLFEKNQQTMDLSIDDLDEATLHQFLNPHLLTFKDSTDGGADVYYDGESINTLIRNEVVAAMASKYAKNPKVRELLLRWQQGFAQAPGLVADGRDMGTVVFPNASFKVFLSANAQKRAQRRFKQLKGKGKNVSLTALVEDIEARDEQDRTRTASPLCAADDALLIDSSDLSIDEVVETIMQYIRTQ